MHSSIIKNFIALPLLTCLVLYCNNTYATDKNNNAKTIEHKGNQITFGEHKIYPSNYASYLREQQRLSYFAILPDSIPKIDPNTGEKFYVAVSKTIIPVSINNQPILGREVQYNLYKEQEKYTDPLYNGKEESIEHYLFAQLQPTLNKLQDGYYNLSTPQLVLDQNGNIAYIGNVSIVQNRGEWDEAIKINPDIKYIVEQRLQNLLESPLGFTPAKLKGQPVNVRLSLSNYVIEVKGHTAKLIERGC